MKITKKRLAKPDDPIYKEGFKTFTPNKHNKINAKKKFSLTKIISNIFLFKVSILHFTIGNNEWGYNSFLISMKYYEKIRKDFGGRKFEKNIVNLLEDSRTKTPQTTSTRKLFFRQKGSSYTHALPGKEIIYSNEHNLKKPYSFAYCNKTKINFFKGPTGDAKIINKLDFENLFSQCFVYGYLETMLCLIFKLGVLDNSKMDKPKFRKSFGGGKLGYRIPIDKMYDNKYLDNLRRQIFEKIFKIKSYEASNIIENIDQSVYQSSLTDFLLSKEENYFVNPISWHDSSYGMYDEEEKKMWEGIKNTQEFCRIITEKKESKYKYKVNKKFKRICKILDETRRTKLSINYNSNLILNYELFRFFTLTDQDYKPINEKKLKLDEKDLFARYAINLGSQESFYYIDQIIFSTEL